MDSFTKWELRRILGGFGGEFAGAAISLLDAPPLIGYLIKE